MFYYDIVHHLVDLRYLPSNFMCYGSFILLPYIFNIMRLVGRTLNTEHKMQKSSVIVILFYRNKENTNSAIKYKLNQTILQLKTLNRLKLACDLDIY